MVVEYKNQILCDSALTVMRRMPDDCVDLVLTSPPYYRQREYNANADGTGQEATPEEYLDGLLETFAEIVRVTKHTGNIVYNLGDKYMNSSLQLLPYRFAMKAVEQCSLLLVNNITWVKRNPTPRQFKRRLVSSTEPFFHFALTRDYYHDRDSFMSDDADKIPPEPTDKLGCKYRPLIDGSDLTADERRNAHQALDDIVQEVKDGILYGFRMKIRGVHTDAFGGQKGGRKTEMQSCGFTMIRLHGNKLKRDVMETPVASTSGINHPAVFPLDLVKELVKMLCPVGGMVLDPYIGSGTTAAAAMHEGRNYCGIEIEPEYCDIALARLTDANAK